ncbi:hypothetical protein O9G_002545 [Rozella allomycis CSF55]|uniref:Uncharacterized protein n=1 Tax=Rozella allomycis (strain CSF55) TaxID=988480 RepID=A0A075AQ01_ROZAC|nr:hypothetical protein O9G_002545 [Rozella allomycis CSF55]|eukprot:EPZ32193.1 hypothetical protein O9G_002545 [Rozella allomycis CSF55]
MKAINHFIYSNHHKKRQEVSATILTEEVIFSVNGANEFSVVPRMRDNELFHFPVVYHRPFLDGALRMRLMYSSLNEETYIVEDKFMWISLTNVLTVFNLIEDSSFENHLIKRTSIDMKTKQNGFNI